MTELQQTIARVAVGALVDTLAAVEAYRRRNAVERCVNRLKQWRGVATRYEKRAGNYRAMVVLAALMLWLA